MKNKIATIIMSIIIILIIGVFSLFGILLWKEIKRMETSVEPENVVTIFQQGEEKEEKDIKAPKIIENPFEGIKDGKKEVNEVDYSNITVDKYFYNQLEEESKTIYKAFESNKENMKTGTYKIELGSSFSDLLSQADGQDQLGKYYQSAIEAYTYDNPDVFYLSPNKMYLNIETTTKGKKVTYGVYINNGNEANYLIDEFSSKEQVNKAIQEIEKERNYILQNKRANTFDNINMVHDYLVDKIEYDSTISKANIYNIYGAMVNGEAVCEGYARSFKYLMDALNIPCTLVIGKGRNSEGKTENHAWNYVQLGNKWYAVDATWDDPVSSTGWVSQSSKTRYFLKGSNDMAKDHTPSNQFTEGGRVFSYPPISSTSY